MMMASILPKQPSKTFQSGRLASKQGLPPGLELSSSRKSLWKTRSTTMFSQLSSILQFDSLSRFCCHSNFSPSWKRHRVFYSLSLILASPIIGKNERRRTTPLLLMWNGSWMQSQQKKKAPLREGSCFYYSRELSLSGQHDIWMGRRFQGYTERDSPRRRS